MNSQTKSGILVIGIGNPLRGDDAVGRLVARHLGKRNVPALRVLEHDGEGASLMEVWKDEKVVMVIDAVSSHTEPGTIHRFDAASEVPQKRLFQASTHAFGLYEALRLARSFGQLPPRLIVYGIEGKSFGIGQRVSDEVKDAASRLVDRILEEAELESRI
ncbi:MAG: hydrogenase maturation protease [Candidatus Acidiferrum sp.]